MKQTRGFTLIELLVVISIIGVLASIVLAATTSSRNKAKDGKIVSDIQQESVQRGDVLISLMENDLVTSIEKILGNQFVVGKDVGAI